MDDLIKQLSERFPENQVYTRPAGFGNKTFSYISVTNYLNRVNEVFDLNDVSITISNRHLDGPIKITQNLRDKYTKKYSEVSFEQYFVTYEVQIKIKDSIREGVGSDQLLIPTLNNGNLSLIYDMDKTSKTAIANAIKKALNYYGVALYLWDDDHPVLQHEEVKQVSQPSPVKQELKFITPYIDELKALKTKLGLSEVEFAEAVQHFIRKEYSEENDGSPRALEAKTAADTKERVEKFKAYMNSGE